MKRESQFVICIGNKGYPASLELRKIYQVIPDRAASRLHQLRVIDESGEDYLYPEGFLCPRNYRRLSSEQRVGPRRRLGMKLRQLLEETSSGVPQPTTN